MLVAQHVAGRPGSTRASEDATTHAVDQGECHSPASADLGENYDSGGQRNIDVGSTEVLARMVFTLVDREVHRIEAAYPHGSDLRLGISSALALSPGPI